MFFVVKSNNNFNFPLGWIKYTVINEYFETLYQGGGGGVLYTNECFDTLYQGCGGIIH